MGFGVEPLRDVVPLPAPSPSERPVDVSLRRVVLTLRRARYGMPDRQRGCEWATHHAINALTRLREHELLYSPLTRPTGEAVRVVALVAGHDRLLCDGLLANEALTPVSQEHCPERRIRNVDIPGKSSCRRRDCHLRAGAGWYPRTPCLYISRTGSSRRARGTS
jgi:hypothetical protein